MSTPSFVAFVKYEQPSYEELRCRFPSFVLPNYEEKIERFNPVDCRPIECRRHVSLGDREVTFEYLEMDEWLSADEALVEMERVGVRPALYEEGLCFDEAHPEEQQKGPIVLLGSAMIDNEDYDPHVACLRTDHFGDPGMGLRMVQLRFVPNCRFLVVREEPAVDNLIASIA